MVKSIDISDITLPTESKILICEIINTLITKYKKIQKCIVFNMLSR